MSAFPDDEFVKDDLDYGEHPCRYCPGGLHPIHIDDQLDGDRYKIVHKLGYGASSTVWLARDKVLQKYIALKIKEAGISKSHNELEILNHISKYKSDHPGRIYSAASLLLRHFWIDGPNGRHLALVFQVCGPSISRLFDWNLRLRTYLARRIAVQVTQGLAYLHSSGICHGDLTAENVLFQLTNFDAWSEHKLHVQLGSPRILDIDQGTGRPRYLVDSAYFFKADPGLLTENIIIVDHSESFFIKSPPLQELRYTNYYAAPEVLFGWDVTVCSDIWAIGCLIYEMHSGTPLFYLAIENPPLEAVSQIIEVLGELPHLWKSVQFNEDGYLERDGCENPVDLSTQYQSFPLDVMVKDIEAERISLPTIDIQVMGGKASSKAWKDKPASSEIRAHIKNNPNLFWKPFPSARFAAIDLTEQSDCQRDIEDEISKNMMPLPKISAKESASLADLLSKILRYEPQQRSSLEDIIQHPWLTAPAESKSCDVSAHWLDKRSGPVP